MITHELMLTLIGGGQEEQVHHPGGPGVYVYIYVYIYCYYIVLYYIILCTTRMRTQNNAKLKRIEDEILEMVHDMI